MLCGVCARNSKHSLGVGNTCLRRLNILEPALHYLGLLGVPFCPRTYDLNIVTCEGDRSLSCSDCSMPL